MFPRYPGDQLVNGLSPRLLLIQTLFLASLIPCPGADTKPAASILQQHGDLQISRLLGDRLQMNQFVTKDGIPGYVEANSLIYRWAAAHFVSADRSHRFFWNAEQPEHIGGLHQVPMNGLVGFVQVATAGGAGKTAAHAFESMWATLFFELCNIQHYKEFTATVNLATHHEISEDDFVRRAAGIEYQSIQDCVSAYKDTWLPWCKDTGFESNREAWVTMDVPFDEWFGYVSTKRLDYVNYYRSYYSRLQPKETGGPQSSRGHAADSSKDGD